MKKNRTYNTAMNIVFGFANKSLAMVLSFIGRAIFVRILAPEYLGLNGLFGDVLMLLSLVDLGFGTAMSYSFYKPLAENNQKKISALITFYKKIYNYIALLVAFLGLAILPFLDYIIKVDQPIPNLKIYYMVFLINTVVSYLFIYKSSIIIADQRSHEISKYSMWINVLRLVVQTIVLISTHSFLFYIAVSIITTITNNLIVSYHANKMYPYIKQKEELESLEKKEIFDNLKSVFIYKVSGVLITGTSNILISILVGTVYVGLYANYNMLISNLTSIASILFSSLTASLGNLVINEKAEKRYEVFKVMQMVSFWLCGVFVICVYFLSEDFIVLWVGNNYLLDHRALIAIIFNFYLALSLQPIWSFREATGLYKKTKYIMLVTAGVSVAGSLVLGNIYGVAGIIGATFISRISTYFWYEPNILYQDIFERNVLSYYMGHIKNLITTLGAAGIIMVIVTDFPVSTISAWFIKAVICFLIVNVIYLLRYYRTKEFHMICRKMKSMIHCYNTTNMC